MTNKQKLFEQSNRNLAEILLCWNIDEGCCAGCVCYNYDRIDKCKAKENNHVGHDCIEAVAKWLAQDVKDE